MEFIADVNQLHRMLEWIVTQLQPMKLARDILHKIELASEEVIMNIIHHAYQEQADKIEIKIQCTQNYAEVIFKDRGAPFNPLQYTSPDCKSSLEKRKVGGLGIHLMRECISDIRYERSEDQNVLTFTIHSSQKR